jgi:hypothetical protein
MGEAVGCQRQVSLPSISFLPSSLSDLVVLQLEPGSVVVDRPLVACKYGTSSSSLCMIHLVVCGTACNEIGRGL